MAKDVDLTSKQWCDMIFEGKNKEYGAYQMRQQSDRRHNLAVLYVAIGLAVIAAGLWGWNLYRIAAEEAEREALAAAAKQKLAQMEMEAKEEEQEVEEIEIEQPETPPEEVVNQQQVTNILIADDNEVTDENQVRSNEEINQNQSQFGHANIDTGKDDAEITEKVQTEVVQAPPVEKKKEEVFRHVEQMPQFPGGDAELYKFISQNLNYPAMAIENGVQGKVIVQFVVTKDGSIGNVKVVRSVDRDLDNEAIRVCKNLPNFIPGKQNGQPVNVWYTLPVTFKLQ